MLIKFIEIYWRLQKCIHSFDTVLLTTAGWSSNRQGYERIYIYIIFFLKLYYEVSHYVNSISSCHVYRIIFNIFTQTLTLKPNHTTGPASWKLLDWISDILL